MVRVFATPAIGYYGDYGFLAPIELSAADMRVVRRVFALLGITLRDDKCRIAGTNNFLGLTGCFPCRGSDYSLSISLTPDKSLMWQRVLAHIVSTRTVPHTASESAIGSLGFAECAVYLRFARCMLHPLYDKLYSTPYYLNVHGRRLGAFKWRSGELPTLRPRVISKRVTRPPPSLTRTLRSKTIAVR